MVVNNDGVSHRPVLYNEIIHALQPMRGRFYVDGTLGAGGHAWGILHASEPDGQLLGLDLDPRALNLARQRLAHFGSRAQIIQASFTTLKEQLEKLDWPAVHGILLDLGVSSMQLDSPERGFAFQFDAPLDMRFDPASPLNAETLVNSLSEMELSRILFAYGEEPNARQIAQEIVRSRPIHTTGELARAVLRVIGDRSGKKRSRTHPATRTFQALRMSVNRELEALEECLPKALKALAPGGRLAVISFHSLEDRIVKSFFRQESVDCICPPRQPVCTCLHRASLAVVTRKPVRPSSEELAENPRARSARLRVAEKLNRFVNG